MVDTGTSFYMHVIIAKGETEKEALKEAGDYMDKNILDSFSKRLTAEIREIPADEKIIYSKRIKNDWAFDVI